MWQRPGTGTAISRTGSAVTGRKEMTAGRLLKKKNRSAALICGEKWRKSTALRFGSPNFFSDQKKILLSCCIPARRKKKNYAVETTLFSSCAQTTGWGADTRR